MEYIVKKVAAFVRWAVGAVLAIIVAAPVYLSAVY